MATMDEMLVELRSARQGLAERDTKTAQRLADIENSLDELYKRMNRPGADGSGAHARLERAEAVALCVQKHQLDQPRDDGVAAAYTPSAGEIEEAALAIKTMRKLLRHADVGKIVDPLERKSLSSFSFGSNGFILPPEMSSRVLSCLVDQTDIAALFNAQTISGGSIRFLIDNAQVDVAAWACETDCFHNNPTPQLQQGLGELEIKAETLRFIVCATSELLEDSAMNLEQWIFTKVSRGFRNAISAALICGDGIGRPVGILNPASGIPICDTAPATPAGTFSWMDLVMLKYAVPMQYHEGGGRGGGGGAYLMNQNTFALCLTMTDAMGRPIWQMMPEGSGMGLSIAGSPVHIVTQMPDVSPGATPVAWGNWPECYTVVVRKNTSMLVDPYSAGFCRLFKFESRVGGAPTCPGAARLLRIR